MKNIRNYKKAVIKHIERTNSSVSGNPNFLLTVTLATGQELTARTKADSMYNYDMLEMRAGDMVDLEVGQHYGKPTINAIQYTRPWRAK